MTAFLRTLLFVSAVIILSLGVFPVLAQVRPIGGGIPCGFPGTTCSGGETVRSINIFIFRAVISFFSLIATAAVIFIIYAGVKLISSKGEPEEAAQGRRQIAYAIIGLFVAMFSIIIVDFITGGAVTGNTYSIANIIVVYLLPVIYRFLAFMGVLAVIFIIYAGVKLITSRGEPEEAAQATRQILYAVIGLFVTGTAIIFVNFLTGGAVTGQFVSIGGILANIIALINVFLAFVGILFVIFLIYAGVKLITSRGQPEEAAQAGRQILYAIIGLIVIAAAYAIATLFTFTPGATVADFIDGYILPFLQIFLAFIGILVVIFLIYAGVLLIASAGNADRAKQAGRQIVYAILGLIVIAVALMLLGVIDVSLSSQKGLTFDLATIMAFIRTAVNLFLGFVALIAAIFIIIAGVMYITSAGNEDQAKSARRAILYVIIGLILVALSAAIVNFIIVAATS